MELFQKVCLTNTRATLARFMELNYALILEANTHRDAKGQRIGQLGLRH